MYYNYFVTIFDSWFLPQGLTMIESLVTNCQFAKVYVVCVDDEVYCSLQKINFRDVIPVKLKEAESTRLLSVKEKRTRAEYCWTLTPFLMDIVFDREPVAQRVTYVDADLFFYKDPSIFFHELDIENKDVLITDHAYDQNKNRSAKSGKYCVQFMVFNRTSNARTIIELWKDRCIEWCYNKYEDGKFGDQKYLEEWVDKYPATVHVSNYLNETLAPWNVDSMLSKYGENFIPTLYHYQSFRVISSIKFRLYSGVRLSSRVDRLYKNYIQAVIRNIKLIESHGIKIVKINEYNTVFDFLKVHAYKLFGLSKYSL